MTPSRDEVLTHVDDFLTYVDARDLAAFLERDAKRQRVEDLSHQFMEACAETHPDLDDGCEW